MAAKTVNFTNNQFLDTVKICMNSNQEEPLKNITFNCFNSESCFKGRTEILKQIQEHIQLNKIVVIHGAPGIGKTETARRFSIQNLDYFDGNIIWIFAETRESLKKSFKDLLKTLRLKVTDDVTQVYNKFRLSRCLFIFDNVENLATVGKYLPCNTLHPTVRVLITSQIAPSDSSVAKVPLEALNMTDALLILEDKLGDKFPKHPRKIWEDLVTYLEGIPLSTQIVAALINQELAKPVRFTKFNLKSFINNLKKNFINYKIPDSEIINYNKSVFNSIRFALERLEKECMDVTLELLRFTAYLEADCIFHPDLLLSPSINQSEELLEDALNKLVQYSLIQVEFTSKATFKVKVHRTIQLVSRKFDLNERNGTMFKSLLKINILKFIHFQFVYEYIKEEEEYKNKSIEFYNENKANAKSYFYNLIKSRCHEVLRELLLKFKDENTESTDYKKILNEMLIHTIRNEYNNLDTINILIEYGAKIDLIPNKSNGFHLASSWLSVQLFDRLLESNNPKKMINSTDGAGQTILHMLVEECNEENTEKTMECMDHLIHKWNADISLRDEDDLTILHTACKNWLLSLGFYKYLVGKHKCKNLVNTRCDLGKTPLQYLFENYHDIPHNPKWKQNLFEIIAYLITECEADISIQDKSKRNTLFYVCRYGTPEIIEFVLTTRDCCDLINIQDNNGDVAFTKLMYNELIKETNIITFMKLFIEYKIDFSTRNKKNKTLVEITQKMKFNELSTEIKKANLNAESTTKTEEIKRDRKISVF